MDNKSLIRLAEYINEVFKTINDVTIQPDNAQTRGKIAQISYLVKVEANA